MNRKEDFGPNKEDNSSLIELIFSQEEAPHTPLPPRKIAKQTEISLSSIRRMIKRRNFSQLKRVKIPEMNDGCRNRRYACAIELAEKSERNTRMFENTVWQDEKDFTLDVPVNLKDDRVYGKEKKSDVPDKNLFSSTNNMSRKVMVSAAFSWYGATKPFFCE